MAPTSPDHQPAGGERDPREVAATMDLALRIGELLLSSGAGASDVSAAMNNVAWACGLRGFSADVTFTELTMSHQSAPGWFRSPRTTTEKAPRGTEMNLRAQHRPYPKPNSSTSTLYWQPPIQ